MATIGQENIALLDRPAYTFLQPTPAIHSSCLQLAKQFLDPIASDVTEAQLLRQKLERQSRKRKRGNAGNKTDSDSLLRMRALYVDNFGVEQVWQQASRILEAALDEVQQALPLQKESEISSEVEEKPKKKGPKKVKFEGDASGSEDSQDIDVDDEIIMEDLNELEEDNDEDEEDFVGEEDSEADVLDVEADIPDEDLSEDEAPTKPFVQDKHGLNDEFFDIDQFNKTTEFLENQDAKGDRNDGAASDEEDVDWATDPMAAGAEAQLSKRKKQRPQKSGKRGKPQPTDESDDSDTGPTFGNGNLSDSSSNSDEDAAPAPEDPTGLTDLGNASDIYYKDFFAAPSKKKLSMKQSKRTGALQGALPARPISSHNRSALAGEQTALSSTNELASNSEDEPSALATEVSRAMTTAHHDLFSDTSSDTGSSSEHSDSPPSHRNLSTHERRQLALRKQIRALEAESISRKPWTLTGEASTPARPLNSLLEEDLDFERAGKPVPLSTRETHESIVALIKRRILARDFNEVPRRLPTELLHPRSRPPPALSDAKPAQSLAAEYEAAYTNAATEAKSEKLRRAHAEIEALWTAVSAQLDALANWHYKPRPAAKEVDVRVHAPTISVEDARPGADGEGAGRLAPQELYDPRARDAEKVDGEVRTKGGAVLAREEDGRDERRRRRRRVKERLRKGAGSAAAVSGGSAGVKAADGAPAKNGRGGGRAAKNAPSAEVVAQLKRGGVKVIDRKGVVRDVDGVAAAKEKVSAGAGALLL